MDEWKVGDPSDWGDHVGVPDIPYMRYINDDGYEEDYSTFPEENGGSKPKSLGSPEEDHGKILLVKAKVYLKWGNLDGAMSCINQAIDIFKNSRRIGYYENSLHVKGMIYEKMEQYARALFFYHKAFKVGECVSNAFDDRNKLIDGDKIDILKEQFKDYRTAYPFGSSLKRDDFIIYWDLAWRINEDSSDTEKLELALEVIGFVKRMAPSIEFVGREKELYENLEKEILEKINK